jgi:hypothetical protein
VLLEVPGFEDAQVDSMVLTDGEPGNAALRTGTPGGSGLASHAPWTGRWSAVGHVEAGMLTASLQCTTALVLRIRAEMK